jgi:hypothetical protein
MHMRRSTQSSRCGAIDVHEWPHIVLGARIALGIAVSFCVGLHASTREVNDAGDRRQAAQRLECSSLTLHAGRESDRLRQVLVFPRTGS